MMETGRAGLFALLLAGGCTDPGGGGGGGKNDKGKPCGVDGGSAFRVSVYDSVIFPYKPDTEAPWDWDGDVPDWMIDVTDALGTILVSPELKTAAEILELVDTYGPLLLEGTVPPDPILYAFAALDDPTTTTTSTFFGGTTYTYTYGTYTFGSYNGLDDTYEPSFSRSFDVDLYDGERLWLWVEDEDLVDDDTVGGFAFELSELRERAKCGIQRIRGGGGNGLYSMSLSVEPL